MMLGIAAKSSIAVPIGRLSGGGQSSVRKMAMPEAERDADQHGDEGGDERAVDRRQRAEISGDGIPGTGDQKSPAEFLEGRRGTDGKRDQDAAKQQ